MVGIMPVNKHIRFIKKYHFRGKNLMAPIGFQSFFPQVVPISLPGWNLETMGWNVWNVQFFGTMVVTTFSL